MLVRVITATVTFLALDAIWLGIIAKSMYANALGDLLRSVDGSMQPLWASAVVVYIALITGILVFAVPKADGKLLAALLWGGLFGVITYATYDFTNLAILAKWSLSISIIDTIWGGVLCGLTTMLTVLIAK